MASGPDRLARLSEAWKVALNIDALRLLRQATTTGLLARKDALKLTGRSDLTRSAAEDLADRLQHADLVRRRPGLPVTFEPTALGEAIVAFIDDHLGEIPAASRPTVLLLDEGGRAQLEAQGMALDEALRVAAVQVATLRQPRK
jgi:hypothetical protein